MQPISRSPQIGALALLVAAAPAFAQHGDDPFHGPTLDADELVAAVLERNPDIEAMRAAVEAAQARPAQMRALDDPMLEGEIAPITIADRSVPLGYQVRLTQRIPFFGKRGLRGEQAEAEVKEMRAGVRDVRLELRQMALEAFADWYEVARAIEINASHRSLLSDMKRSAEAQYGAGRAAQQDPLQAERMLAELEQEEVELDARRNVIRARINGLVHRPLGAAVPPPVGALPLDGATPEGALERAKASSPEIEALDARIAGAGAAASLARKAWLPDLQIMGSYNSMWMDPQMRLMVGVGIEIPLQFARRSAENDEARARLRQLQLQRAHRLQEVEVAAHAAVEELTSAVKVVAVQRDRVLPTARAQLDSARAGYVSGRNEFQALIEAERSLRDAELRLHRALADVVRRRAALERVMGEDR